MRRRETQFRSAEEIVSEIERLQKYGYERTKNWNLTQICEHLEATMRGGMDGFGFRLPWLLRATIVKWVFRYALRTRKLLSGAPTLSVLKPKSENQTDDSEKIESCIRVLREAASFQGSLDDYAMLDNLAVDDWKQFMWIHASHHLSFLIPKPMK